MVLQGLLASLGCPIPFALLGQQLATLLLAQPAQVDRIGLVTGCIRIVLVCFSSIVVKWTVGAL